MSLTTAALRDVFPYAYHRLNAFEDKSLMAPSVVPLGVSEDAVASLSSKIHGFQNKPLHVHTEASGDMKDIPVHLTTDHPSRLTTVQDRLWPLQNLGRRRVCSTSALTSYPDTQRLVDNNAALDLSLKRKSRSPPRERPDDNVFSNNCPSKRLNLSGTLGHSSQSFNNVGATLSPWHIPDSVKTEAPSLPSHHTSSLSKRISRSPIPRHRFEGVPKLAAFGKIDSNISEYLYNKNPDLFQSYHNYSNSKLSVGEMKPLKPWDSKAKTVDFNIKKELILEPNQCKQRLSSSSRYPTLPSSFDCAAKSQPRCEPASTATLPHNSCVFVDGERREPPALMSPGGHLVSSFSEQSSAEIGITSSGDPDHSDTASRTNKVTFKKDLMKRYCKFCREKYLV